MRRDEVPRGWSPLRCLRCDDHLAMPPDVTEVERQALCAEHHLWLCTNPTPNAVRARHRAARGMWPDP